MSMPMVKRQWTVADRDDLEEAVRERARLAGEPQGIGQAQAFLSILLT